MKNKKRKNNRRLPVIRSKQLTLPYMGVEPAALNPENAWFTMKESGAGELEIMIYDVIAEYGVNAQDFVNMLRSQPKAKKILLDINSPGGSVFDGNAIYNELMEYGATIETTVTGIAASMASILAMTGDKVRMHANSFMMIHNPLVGIIGDSSQLRKEAEVLDKIKTNAIAAYKRHAKTLSEKQIDDLMTAETYMTAAEALKMGFCDEVIEERDIEEVMFGGLAVPESVYSAVLGVRSSIPDFEKYDRFRKSGSAIFAREKESDHWNMLNLQAAKGSKPIAAAKPPAKPAAKSPVFNLETIKPPKEIPMNLFINEKGDLVNRDTKEVVKTRDQLLAEGVNIVLVTKDAHAKELEEARQQAIVDENTRVSGIAAICEGFPQLDSAFVAELKKPGVTVAEVQAKVLEKVRAGLTPISPIPGGDETDKTRKALVNTLLVAGGVERDRKIVDEVRASEMGNITGLQGLVRFFGARAKIRGVETAGSSDLGRVFKELLYNAPQMGMGMNTNDLYSVLETANNISLLKGYREAPTTYQAVSKQISVSDLKVQKFFKQSEAPDVLEIPEGQPAKLSRVSDKYEQGSLTKWGRAYSVTEEMIINDRLDIVTSLPEQYGRAIAREINYQYWYTLMNGNGPTLIETAVALFQTSGNFQNQALVAAAIAEATLATGFEEMMTYAMISPDGNTSRTQTTSLTPRTLCVGPNNALLANKFTANPYTPDSTEDKSAVLNFFGPGQRWSLQPLIEPLIQTLNPTKKNWLLALDPSDQDYAFILTLAGREEPTTDSKIGGAGEVKGVIFDIQHFFKPLFVDWRGFWKNAGATVS